MRTAVRAGWLGFWVLALGLLGTFCPGASLHAQSHADSLRQRMRSAQDPASYAALLLQLCDDQRNGSLDSVEHWGQQLVRIGQDIHDPRIVSDGYAQLAWYHRNKGNLLQGGRFAEMAIDQAQAGQDPHRKGIALYEVGMIQNLQDSWSMAQQTMMWARSLFRQTSDPVREARCLNAVGESYRLRNSLDTASAYYNLAAPLFAQGHYTHGAFIIRNNRGLVLLARQQYQQAIDSLLPVMDYACDKEAEALYLESSNAIASAYLGLGDHEQARKFGKISYSRSYLLGFKTYTRDAARTLYDIFLAQKDYPMAMCYLMQHYEFANDIVTEASQNHIRSLNYDLQLRDKESEIVVLRQEQQIRQLTGLVAGVVLGLMLIIGGILYYSYRRKRRDNRLLEAKNDALANLVQEKNGLINVVAHDLKAPINKSRALLEMLLDGGELSTPQMKAALMMQKSLEDGDRLIRDLLDISQGENHQLVVSPTHFDLAQLLDQQHREFSGTAAKKHITIQLQAPHTPLPLYADSGFVARILENLLSNAIKYSPAGTTVSLACGATSDECWFQVRDQGPGFSPEDRDKMYRKFQRLSARPTAGESSNGLGLAIIRTLLEQLGGHIELDTTPGKGATFTVRIPSATPPLVPA